MSGWRPRNIMDPPLLIHALFKDVRYDARQLASAEIYDDVSAVATKGLLRILRRHRLASRT